MFYCMTHLMLRSGKTLFEKVFSSLVRKGSANLKLGSLYEP